jgi:TRAP-type C4-dicarboxylate transport system permease small subunit
MKAKLKLIWDNLEISIMMVLFGGLMINVTGQIIARTVFTFPLSFSEEISRYCFVWLCFLSISLAIRKKIHIKLEVFRRPFPQIVNTILDYTTEIMTLAVFIWMFKYGLDFVIFTMSRTSYALGIPFGVYTSVLPVSCALVIIRTGENFVKKIRDGLNKKAREGA